MNTRHSPNSKVCGTCDFWIGQRTLTTTRTHVEVADGTYGDCNADRIKKTHKMHNATCPKWQIWGPIRDSSKINRDNIKKASNVVGGFGKSSKSENKKGTISFLKFIFIAGVIAAIRFIVAYWDYFKSISLIIIPCIIICFLFYKTAKKPKLKIIITVLLGIILSAILAVNISRKKEDLHEQKMQIAQTIRTATVNNGYKPAFGSGNIYSTEYDKIVVNGYVEYSAYDNYYTLSDAVSHENIRLDTNSLNKYYQKTTGSNAPKSTSMGLWGIFFLTKTNNSVTSYIIDDIIEYKYTGEAPNDLRGLVEEITSTNLMEYSFRQGMEGVHILDTWILNHQD